MIIIDVDKITIDQLPQDEDDYYEYKSSLTPDDKLKDKLQKAVSGFANSGGGFFIAGINDKTGEVDGGISLQIGRQSRRDWVDIVVSQIEPKPKYSVKLLDDVDGRGFLKEAHAVLIVAIEESTIGPHMAADNRYYIRNGAHTVPARHYIVEAIRAKRFSTNPKLSHVFRLKPGYEQVLQLGIVAITNAPAVNVILSLFPLPKLLKARAQDFPIKLPLIDQNNPFFFDVSLYFESEESFGRDVKLNIEYDDLLQNHYVQELVIGIESTPPILIGNPNKEIIGALNSIEKALLKLSLRANNSLNDTD
ncbi:helix-turn-helix domain-containing protein [Spirosoma sp. KNUC1025]|uniref:AlbA family DNA-binding domain-containing protein n=1 Tax=Spirosoma sp. KNUC1025 TaxID=2894082 RepID=UPI00386C30BE|nr:ATP-binding protein [Spirosoma sp. KNUC1025]